ncbi:Eco57I restriction-modification methylase domain-containing protein [Thermosynechococcus sp. FA-CM-4201]
MNEMRLKQEIERAIQRFATDNLADCTQNLFHTLGYGTNKSIRLEAPTPSAFIEQFAQEKSISTEDWQFVDLVFQLTKDEITGNEQAKLDFSKQSRVDNTIIESYLFIAIELVGSQHSRTKLATIAREVNKLFAMPVMVLFKYGQTISLAIIDREINKRDESKDVLRKVTLIKDVSIARPHRAHIEILFDLSLGELHKKYKFTNFVELHRAWQNTLNITELNKQFFQEISNWYFWARECVCFPDSAPKDEEGKDSASLIRLITRLIFIWFLKEKKGEDGQPLVPDELFRKDYLQNLIDLDDANATTYYKAILQNLFFATLNQEMNTPDKPDNRKFRGKSRSNGQDQHYMIHNVYRYEDLFRNADQALKLFESIPFLNGGLFECLDYLDPQTKKQVRIDGFSDRPDNKLTVPNYLFFSEEQTVDLNQAYGTKNKRYKVRGLIDIFNRYKFTITENTPIEEEIALDPELLGKVFENLLAAYNPETKVTARKQTGSFYTPREVVDYMVNQSLLLYLEDKIAGKPQHREKLEQLLDYSTPTNPFADDPEATDLLISAIDNLKVLDPAVGSGAFPMGILQKLVFILGKLDPNNARWKRQQREREILPVLNDLQQAQKISYEEARLAAIQQLEERLAQIEADFANNEMDYPRKLFLIENCIYGVDIQPIAVQIAKLRFFISLIVEQKVNDHAPNRGILPLPNLETKFVSANTLIGISSQLNLRSPGVIALEQELKEIRRKHFTARTPKTKMKYRQRDEEIRCEIARLLTETGLEPATSDTLAKWNPYNQNASANFFDAEWMFGIREGFDIIIGNPPYVRQEQIKELKPALQREYDCYTGTADLFVYFYERGFRLLRENGYLAYITSNKYFRSAYGEKLRDFLCQNATIKSIIDFGDTSVFEAIAYPSILIFKKCKPNQQSITALTWKPEFDLNNFASTFQTQHFTVNQKELTADGWRLESSTVLALLDKLRKAGKPLGEYVNGRFYYGIKTGCNEAFVIDRATRDRLIAEHPSSAEVIKPFLRGRDVKRWSIEFAEQYLLFIPWHFPLHQDISITGASLRAEEEFSKLYPAIYKHMLKFKPQLSARNKSETGIRYEWYALQRWGANYWQEFEQPKIILGIFMDKPTFAFDRNGLFVNNALHIIAGADEYVTSILNSSIGWYYLKKLCTDLQNGYLQAYKENLEKIPIPNPTLEDRTILERLVQQCISAKGQGVDQWEREIDQIVAKLYGLTPEEMQIIKGVAC